MGPSEIILVLIVIMIALIARGNYHKRKRYAALGSLDRAIDQSNARVDSYKKIHGGIVFSNLAEMVEVDSDTYKEIVMTRIDIDTMSCFGREGKEPMVACGAVKGDDIKYMGTMAIRWPSGWYYYAHPSVVPNNV